MLVAFSVAAAAWNIARAGLDANAAAWVQAAGAIAAIAGAVWLFQAEAKVRRQEWRKERQANAWGVRYALTQAQFEVWEICDSLPSEGSTLDPDQPRQWRIQTTCAKSILQNFVSRTDHIHPDLIRLAMNGVMLVEELEHRLSDVAAAIANGSHPRAETIERIEAFKVHFHCLLTLFDERMRGVILAFNRSGGDFPTLEIPEWQVPPDHPARGESH